MRLGGIADYLTEANTKDELIEIIEWAKSKKLNMLMVGSGSNIVWRDEGFKGLVIVNKIMGFEASDDDQENLYLTVGAGEDWDSVVERTVELGFSGIESLSLIPGTTGSTPVQNVGAYGSEIADTFVSLEAYDTEANEFIVIQASECGFGYRTSRFKKKDKHRYFIITITLHLTRERKESPLYGSVQKYLEDNNIDEITPEAIRKAVISIRQSKLPDPKVVPNNGSFFTNPIIDSVLFEKLEKEYSSISYWKVDKDSYKLSAAWLIEEAGYKAINDPETGISTWPTQSLVLVNTSAKKTSDLLKFRDKIIKDVKNKFNVTLTQEPELLP
jgi:UDP-N-acetylmuramate dehydrogenase